MQQNPTFRRGRPSKYHKKYNKVAIEFLAKGFSKEALAGELGISRDTLYEWCKVHPEFSYTVEVGEAYSLHFWEKVGKDALEGKIKGFKPAIWLLIMRNRFQHKYVKDVDQEIKKLNAKEEPKSSSLTLEKVLDMHINSRLSVNNSR